MYNPVMSIAQFVSNVFESGSLDYLVILSLCERSCVEKDQNWHDEETSFVFGDGSIVVLGPQSVEVEESENET